VFGEILQCADPALQPPHQAVEREATILEGVSRLAHSFDQQPDMLRFVHHRTFRNPELTVITRPFSTMTVRLLAEL